MFHSFVFITAPISLLSVINKAKYLPSALLHFAARCCTNYWLAPVSTVQVCWNLIHSYCGVCIPVISCVLL